MLFYVIPYLLAVRFPSHMLENDILSPEITFEARITTTTTYSNDYIRDRWHVDFTFFENRDSSEIKDQDAAMTIEIKCRSYQINALLCHISNHRFHPSGLRNLVIINNQFRQTVFQMRFNDAGVFDYTIEKTDRNTMDFLFNLYRFFGTQLSVGTKNTQYWDSLFYSDEESVIGLCSTGFVIKRTNYTDSQISLPDKTISRRLVNDLSNKDELISIFKERDTIRCGVTSNYMFATNFWSEFLPSDIEEVMVSSQSNMILSNNSFYSQMTNVFDLYDLDMKVSGKAIETIDVTLQSVNFPDESQSRVFLRPIIKKVIASKRNE